MLQIKKLQMLGFKSFCDRTEMLFPGTGVVAIVGPNGCGKSNIADAVSWVLGEQSAKTLRGGQMADVIFAGTRDRAATGMAEVSLTLVDPQEYGQPSPDTAAAADAAHAADANDEAAEEPEAAETGDWDEEVNPRPAAAEGNGQGVVLTIRTRRKFTPHNRRGEIVVTRRLYRSGESEYLMNHRPCRLRDIQDLFLGTGLGPESYAIIEQGRIGQILSSKPHDRRAVIEEAAGVSKYKTRRRMAEARLEAARLNLSRLNDIFEEVTRQVGSLKRQAAKAQRYRALKAEFDATQRELVLRRADALEAALGEIQALQQEARAAVQGQQTAIQERETARAEGARRCAALEDDLRRLGEEVARVARELDHGAQQIAFYAQQDEELRQRHLGHEAEAARVREQQGRLGEELGAAQAELRESDGALAEARTSGAAAAAAQQRAAAAVHELEAGLEAIRRQGIELMAAAGRHSHQIAQGEAQLAGLERALDRLREQMGAAERELEAAGARRGQLTLAFQDQEAESQRLAERAQALAPRAERLRQREAEERREAEAERARLAEHGARRRSLEEVVAHHGYSSEAVKQLFATAATAPGRGPIAAGVPMEDAPAAAATPRFQPLGVLGEFVEVESQFEHVVEQFLHEELDYVVVHTWDEAGAGVGLLRAQEQGRATFLVHAGQDTLVESGEAVEERRRLEQVEGLTPLMREVKALNGFRGGLGRVLPKLGNAYLLDDSERARRLALGYPHAWFLTPDGECFHHCTVTGGAGRAGGPLSLKRELRELARAEAALRFALAERERGLETLVAERENVQRELEDLAARRHEMEKSLLTSGQAVRQVEGELQRVETQLKHDRVESERVRQERLAIEERLEQARHELQARQREQQESQARQEGAAERLAEARGDAERAGQELAEARALLARREERAAAATTACARIARMSTELERRLGQLLAEAESMSSRRLELAASRTEWESRLEGLRHDAAAAAARQGEGETALAAARGAAAQLEEELSAARTRLEALRAAAAEHEVALARLEGDAGHLREVCRNDLGLELEELRAQATAPPAADAAEAAVETAEPASPADRLAALETAARELRHKIENLGPVNMMALEEYEEAQQRHAFMEAQRKDLYDSILDTQKAIAEIDVVSREKFAAAFEQINLYFQETFQGLFGGGQGFLRLSEMEGEGDAGVDLVAQPPGKKLQNALLLSGGEKAMTAMALLLAIFRFQPSPFCLLDEVDAPMDEANVGRFSEMVQRMAGGTQFLIITHNKRTMEVAPTLYGVTMPQPGVSRLVSVMVDEAQAAIA